MKLSHLTTLLALGVAAVAPAMANTTTVGSLNTFFGTHSVDFYGAVGVSTLNPAPDNTFKDSNSTFSGQIGLTLNYVDLVIPNVGGFRAGFRGDITFADSRATKIGTNIYRWQDSSYFVGGTARFQIAKVFIEGSLGYDFSNIVRVDPTQISSSRLVEQFGNSVAKEVGFGLAQDNYYVGGYYRSSSKSENPAISTSGYFLRAGFGF